MKTTPFMTLGLYGVDSKQVSYADSVDVQPFCDLTDLRTDNATNTPYATFEPDYWLLDGSYRTVPQSGTVHMGYMSLSQSDASGEFPPDAAPYVEIIFTSPQVIKGLLLKFCQQSGDYCSTVVAEFFDDEETLLFTDTYNPTSWLFSVSYEEAEWIADCTVIALSFTITSKPYRFARLSNIDYGESYVFDTSVIKSAKTLEECNPIGSEARVGTLDVELHSTDLDLSIMNPSGIFAKLKENEPLSMYVTAGLLTTFIGQFYLDSWVSLSPTNIKLHCVDLLGMLDKETQMGWLYSAADAVTLADELNYLLAASGIYAPYELDASLAAVPVIGWLPICSYRVALQHLCFASGAQIICSRDKPMRIVPAELVGEAADEAIGDDSRGARTEIELMPRVTGVDVVAHDFTEGDEVRTLLDSTMAAGTYEIRFPQPVHTLSITGATINDSSSNYASITVSSPGAVLLTGEAYIDTQTRFEVRDGTIDPAQSRAHIMKVEGCPLVYSGIAQATAQRVYDYYQQRYQQSAKLFAPTITVGQSAQVSAQPGYSIRGIVERMESNLAGGFTSQVRIRGISVED